MFEDVTPQERQEMTDLLRKTGSPSKEEASVAQKLFAAALTTPLRQGILYGDIISNIFKPEVFDAVEALQAIAAEKGCSLAQFAIAWLMAQKNVTSPIIGAGDQKQFDDLLGALNIQITAEDCQRVDAICPPGTAIVPYYRPDPYADFRPHPYRW